MVLSPINEGTANLTPVVQDNFISELAPSHIKNAMWRMIPITQGLVSGTTQTDTYKLRGLLSHKDAFSNASGGRLLINEPSPGTAVDVKAKEAWWRFKFREESGDTTNAFIPQPQR